MSDNDPHDQYAPAIDAEHVGLAHNPGRDRQGGMLVRNRSDRITRITVTADISLTIRDVTTPASMATIMKKYRVDYRLQAGGDQA